MGNELEYVLNCYIQLLYLVNIRPDLKIIVILDITSLVYVHVPFPWSAAELFVCSDRRTETGVRMFAHTGQYLSLPTLRCCNSDVGVEIKSINYSSCSRPGQM